VPRGTFYENVSSPIIFLISCRTSLLGAPNIRSHITKVCHVAHFCQISTLVTILGLDMDQMPDVLLPVEMLPIVARERTPTGRIPMSMDSKRDGASDVH
jgi:hypothetical protein